VSKRLGSIYRSGRSPDWLKFKNPAAPAVRRKAEEDWGKMKDRKHFAHRIDMWDDDGESVAEYLASVEDFDLAMSTFRAACLRWPGAAITIRQGARILEDSRKRRLA